ncbi:hypothetical protein C8R45DRAFT_931011 [Mycena sanguinolenta]|nr:hypothetical protein C8R45DRAFT_931011 [Mycena sanguinolenta]
MLLKRSFLSSAIARVSGVSTGLRSRVGAITRVTSTAFTIPPPIMVIMQQPVGTAARDLAPPLICATTAPLLCNPLATLLTAHHLQAHHNPSPDDDGGDGLMDFDDNNELHQGDDDADPGDKGKKRAASQGTHACKRARNT